MLADWGLDDSRSWRPGYLRPGERAGEIQASARGKGRRSGGRSAGKGGGGAAHEIRVQGARRWSFLPNGVFVVSRCIVASVEVVPY